MPIMDSNLLQDVITLVRNQIGHGTFKNLEETTEDDPETEVLKPISNLEMKESSNVKPGSQTSEVRMLRMAFQDFVHNMHSELRNPGTSLVRSIYEMRRATEQMQQSAELYERLQIISYNFKDFVNMIKATSQMDVTAHSIQFRAKWKAYNIISLTHLLLMTNEYKAAKDASKHVIFWLQENIGNKAKTTSLHGFSCHILAIIHRVQNNYETAVHYYESALDAYRGEVDWIDAKVQKNLIRVIGAKLEHAKEKVNYVRASIGRKGGRLGLNSCQVQIPQDALRSTKQFTLSTSLVSNYEEDYAPISAVLQCEPSTNFESTVTIALPTWCEVHTGSGKVIVDVFCLSNAMSKPEPIENINLQDAGETITFDSQHFSAFFTMIKKTLLRMVDFKVTMSIWKSPEGNYNFILSAMDETVEKKWQEELKSRNYAVTKAVMSPTVVKYKEELTLTMICEEGNFKPSHHNLIADFYYSQTFHRTFVLKLNEEGPSQTNITVSCTVKGAKGKVFQDLQWSETATNTGHQGARLEDVFQDEIVKEFSSTTLWKQFARSKNGLKLSTAEVTTIISDHFGDLEGQKIAMLDRWRDITAGNEATLILKIRSAVEKFRHHIQT